MISAFQVPVTSTPSLVAVIPPGPCTVTLSNAGAATIYVGEPGISTSTGLPVAGHSKKPVMITGFKGSESAALWAVITGTPPLLAASSAVPGVFKPGAAVPASPGASGGDTAYLGIIIQR